MFACELPVGSEHAASGAKQQATVKCVCVYVCMCVCVYVCIYVYYRVNLSKSCGGAPP